MLYALCPVPHALYPGDPDQGPDRGAHRLQGEEEAGVQGRVGLGAWEPVVLILAAY